MKSYVKLICLLSVLTCLCNAAPEKTPVEITEENWRDTLQGEWMVEFMAPWCPACRSFTDTWKKFAGWSDDLDFKVGVVDVTENPGLSGRFMVSALPSIYHVKDGIFRQYKGGRKETDLISFIDDKKWIDIQPVDWYWAPNTIQMGTVAFFFKSAMFIRNLHSTMMSEYGIPEWGCYLIFAVITICTGLILGLLIVCCCDMVFPPKYYSPPKTSENQKKIEEQRKMAPEQDDGTEDIIDDTQDTVTEDEGTETEEGSQAEETEEKEEETQETVSPSPKPRKRRAKKAD